MALAKGFDAADDTTKVQLTGLFKHGWAAVLGEIRRLKRPSRPKPPPLPKDVTDTDDIIHGNCLDVLPTIPEPYFLVSDPPYNQGYHYDGYQDSLPAEKYRDLLLRVFQGRRAVIILYPEETIGVLSALGTPEQVVCWIYPSNTAKQSRLITWWNCKPDFTRLGQPYRNPTDRRIAPRIERGCDARLYDWWAIDQIKNVSKAGFNRPCPIPEEVARRIILLTTDVGDLVVDPFCGSGTIPYVAKQYERRSIGIDISENYCEIARRRLSGAATVEEVQYPGAQIIQLDDARAERARWYPSRYWADLWEKQQASRQ
jgi:hypothetical protein